MFGKSRKEKEKEQERKDEQYMAAIEETRKKVREEKHSFYETRNYKIVHARQLIDSRDGKESLESEVQKHIELKWRVHGSVFTMTESVWSPSGGSNTVSYCQPMINY